MRLLDAYDVDPRQARLRLGRRPILGKSVGMLLFGEVSPKHDARLTGAGVVGDFRGRHVEREVKGNRIVVGRDADRLERRGATVAGERLELAIQSSPEASSPRIGTHANEMHVTNSSRCDESEEIRRHASAPVTHYEGRIPELVNEH